MAGTIVANTINTDTVGAVFTTNNAMNGIAKAWAYFTVSGTTVTIQNSFNVSSITRNGTGDYTVTLATANGNANLCGVIGAGLSTDATNWLVGYPYTSGSPPYTQASTSSTLRFTTVAGTTSTTLKDPQFCAVTIFAS
jgi:hypothetical protein